MGREVATQKGLVLHAGSGRAATPIDVPRPPADHNKIVTADYAPCLPGANVDHLLLAAVPFSEAAGCPALLVYDESSTQELNASASRLTTNVEDGLSLEVKGDALVLFQAPGSDFGLVDWEQLDNVVYDELLEYFGQGVRPKPADIQKLVADFRSGRFAYKQHEGEEDEDANKDDGGESLPEALEQARAAH